MEPMTEPAAKPGTVRLSVTVTQELYERVMALKARTRRPTSDLAAAWIAAGVEKMEKELREQ